jgi:exopolyphosphatase/guanosine-5'-triphosphate,3'-diphosphate pyrophosphatase
VSRAHLAELKRILSESGAIMKNYGVESYRACGTSAFREMKNSNMILAQIEQETGIHIDILENTEQRFMDYKSLASKGAVFTKLLEQPTAIVDIGGGSVQVSLFEKDRLSASQNLRLGVLRIREQLERVGARSVQNESLIEEIVNTQLNVFKKLYLKDRDIKQIVVIDDYLADAANDAGNFSGAGKTISGPMGQAEFIDAAALNNFIEGLRNRSTIELSDQLKISDEKIPLLQISSIIIKCIAKAVKADVIWIPGVTLCDGIVYDYATTKKFIKPDHDFEQDILTCALQTSKRYKGSEERAKTLEFLALQIFDSMKRVHGMGSRERLLIRLCAILHDCGKYISMQNLSDCSYNIIKSTEIIGLSAREREIVANVVRYNHSDFVFYEEREDFGILTRSDYMIITKLTAILRLANGLDRSHKKKFTDVRIRLREGQLQISVSTKKDITLEKGLFSRRADFFEEIFSVRPVIRQREF